MIIIILNLISTILFEVIIAFILKVKEKKDYLNIILVNILTNPIVTTIPFYMNVRHGLMYRHVSLLILEILTIIIEGYIYKKYLLYKSLSPYLLSFILNLSSYFIGIIINNIIY